jgi:hypothetical protein
MVKFGQATPTAKGAGDGGCAPASLVPCPDEWRQHRPCSATEGKPAKLTSPSCSFLISSSIASELCCAGIFLRTRASPAQILTALRISGARWMRLRCRECSGADPAAEGANSETVKARFASFCSAVSGAADPVACAMLSRRHREGAAEQSSRDATFSSLIVKATAAAHAELPLL